MKKNDEIRLKIESISSTGSGVGHISNMAVFVSGTATGDEIIAHIIKVKKTYAIGIIKEIIVPSKDRIESSCPISVACGGCVYRHITYKSEYESKYRRVKDAFLHIGHIDITPEPIIYAKNTDRYRNKAQFPIGTDKNGKTVIGFYSQKSHRIVPCEDCLLQPESFGKILNAVKNFLDEKRIPSYNEETNEGIARHIYIREGKITGEKLVCLVINGDTLPYCEEFVQAVINADSKVKSVILNINKEKTNVILGKRCVNLYRDGYITDILCGKNFRISPLSFYQVNHDQTESLYEKAKEYANLKGDEILLDLYCGAGTIGLTMADGVKKLIGVEIIPEAIEDAKENARINGITNGEFFCDDAKGTAKKLLERGLKPDVIILDPPRKGCDEEVLTAVSGMKPKRIVYVSCDPATLARDAQKLEKLGYCVKKVTPVDMFPRTGHVESVVLLTKVHN